MPNEIGNPTPQPLIIPMDKIHEMPGVFTPRPPERSLGGLITSIQSGGIKEPVILRQREDGEYQLLSGYRRRRANELAHNKDIPAFVYEMTTQEAIAYRKAVRENPDTPIPGKLLNPPAEQDKGVEAEVPVVSEDKDSGQMKIGAVDAEETPKVPEQDEPAKEGDAPAVPGDESKEQSEAADREKLETAPAAEEKEPDAPAEEVQTNPPEQNGQAKDGDAPAVPGDVNKEQTEAADRENPETTPAAEEKKPETPAEEVKTNPPEQDGQAKDGEAPAVPGGENKEQTETASKDNSEPAPGAEEKEPGAPTEAASQEDHLPTVAELEAKAKSGEPVNISDLIAAQQREREAKVDAPAPEQPKRRGRPKASLRPSSSEAQRTAKKAEEKTAEAPAMEAAIKGGASTAITQVLEDHLTPPGADALKSIPVPGDGESYFVTLHPAYLEKSPLNTFSVDTESENFKELCKSIELVGIKDPVLARFNAQGKLEILSGQRRHLAASTLNRAVPTIIQKIDDADAKILVADGNLHRDKISSYDLSRALRMKMEGMKQKAGRRKKGYSSAELQSDEKLAREMGMSIAKLNRIIHLSEAVKGVCDLVDDNKLTISVASEISYLKPKNQEALLHLMALDYKPTNVQIQRMKKAEAGGTLDDMTMRNILADKDIAPKQEKPKPVESAPAPQPAAEPPAKETPAPPTNAPTVIPPSPDVAAPVNTSEAPTNAPTPEMSANALAPETPPSAVPAAETPDAPKTPDAPETPEPSRAPDTTPAPAPVTPTEEKNESPFKGEQERPEVTKVILTGDRLRKYFPDVSMTPREIEESVYDALEERRQRQIKQQEKAAIFKKSGPTR